MPSTMKRSDGGFETYLPIVTYEYFFDNILEKLNN